MAIGVFDSGIGGLSVHRVLTDRLALADFVYLADQAHVPYGTKTGEEIVTLTRIGCERLFREGCDLVLLACNTASAVALRRLQQSWLPGVRAALARPVNVLGIIVPTIEVATGRPWDPLCLPASRAASPGQKIVGIFATPATAQSQVYEIEITKRHQSLFVVSEPCQDLAALIEQGADTDQLSFVIQQHVSAMIGRSGRVPDKIILGSTHYEVVSHLFRQALPPSTELIQQPCATVEALEAYLVRHREFHPGTSGLRRFLTTGRAGSQHNLVESYWGKPLLFDAA